MGLSIEDKLINPIMLNLPHITLSYSVSFTLKFQGPTPKPYWSMNQITVFHNLCEQKTVLEVIKPPPPAALTFCSSANPLPTLQVSLIATNAFQAQSLYV
jgi:hypothetical protein